jgi:basic amino acid/polyamine antiporter, APA family
VIDEPPRNSPPQLVRAIGRWSMVALAINSIIGSGIFGLPSALAGLVGRASPLLVLIAGAAMGVIIACYAEVASQFTGTGGTYLYLQRAFGRLIGIQVGWMSLLVRLTACAASVDLLVAYLGEFWPGATEPVARVVVISAFIGGLAVVNYRGVGGGTLMSNATVVAKLLALGAVCVAGVVWLSVYGLPPAPPAPTPQASAWRRALLLLFFAYGGYEAALNPMGEARNPRRDVAFALLGALLIVTVLYSTLQLVVVGVLPDPAHSERPLADVAQALMGRSGAVLISVGALISVYGYVSANLLNMPRGLFALAERGDFPRAFAAVHPRWRTPYVSIAVFAALVWIFSQFGGFTSNVTLAAFARLFYYGAVCLAVPVLRRRQPDAAVFRIPGGDLVLPAVGVLLCAVLLSGVDFSKSLILIATIGVALLNWALVRKRDAPAVVP